MGSGEFFGEQALIYECQRTATVTTFGDCTCLSLSRDNLFKTLGGNIEQVIFQNTMRMIIESSEHLGVLLPEQIDKIVHTVEVKEYKTDDVVIQADTPMKDNLYLVVKGKMKGYEKGRISIGDEAFATKNPRYHDEIKAEKDSYVGSITIEKFEEIIGGNLNDVVEGN